MYHVDPHSMYMSEDRHLLGSIHCALTKTPPGNTNRKHGGMLIATEFFVKDQSELDSPELDSPLSYSSQLEEEPEESKLDDDTLWLLGLQTHTELPWECSKKRHGTCVPCNIACLLPFLPTPAVLKSKIEDCGYNIVTFCTGAPFYRGAKERTT